MDLEEELLLRDPEEELLFKDPQEELLARSFNRRLCVARSHGMSTKGPTYCCSGKCRSYIAQRQQLSSF